MVPNAPLDRQLLDCLLRLMHNAYVNAPILESRFIITLVLTKGSFTNFVCKRPLLARRIRRARRDGLLYTITSYVIGIGGGGFHITGVGGCRR